MEPARDLPAEELILLTGLLNAAPQIAAQGLLGWTLVAVDMESRQEVGGIICETEAYLASHDPAAHSRRGKTTANASLFAPAGTLYIHPMRQHILMDIVTQNELLAGSVLIRALQPTIGIETMKERRQTNDLFKLCRGPGNLCKSLDIGRDLDGMNILNDPSRVRLISKCGTPVKTVTLSKRVGVSRDLDECLRFHFGDRAFISK